MGERCSQQLQDFDMPQDLSAIAELKSVTKWLGRTGDLRDLDLAIGAGEVTALLRPHGAVKTTAVGLLTGRLQPDRGTARLFGFDPSRPAGRARTGVMLQASGRRHAEFQGIGDASIGLYKEPRPVAETLAITGLGELAERRCGALSGGRPS
jgi:ABC-2 type transport system ATP-binding protein